MLVDELLEPRQLVAIPGDGARNAVPAELHPLKELVDGLGERDGWLGASHPPPSYAGTFLNLRFPQLARFVAIGPTSEGEVRCRLTGSRRPETSLRGRCLMPSWHLTRQTPQEHNS